MQNVSVVLTALPLVVQLNDPVHCPNICIAPLLGLSNFFRVATSVCMLDAEAYWSPPRLNYCILGCAKHPSLSPALNRLMSSILGCEM